MISAAGLPHAPLPNVADFLAGKDGIRPLQHAADALRNFLLQFSDVSLPEKAAQTVVKLQDAMENPNWKTAHDAARASMDEVRGMTEGLIAPHRNMASAVNIIFNARAPDAASVEMIQTPDLQVALAPFVNYLKEFGQSLKWWVSIDPARLTLKEGVEGVAPSVQRLIRQASHTVASCGDPTCNVNHVAETVVEQIATAVPTNNTQALILGAGIVGALGVGAYLVNAYGKKPTNDVKPTNGAIAGRVSEPVTMVQK